MTSLNTETVLSLDHWTDTLFSFRTTRDPAFRFESGQFTMIGLEVDGRPLLRAYSMASANYEENLEFFSIKVPDGPLTSRLKQIKVGDKILVGRKPTGTLVLHNLLPGRRLLLLSTGTGLAPFASLLKDPQLYELYDSVCLVHGCRLVSELAYGDRLVAILMEDEFLGPTASKQLLYLPTVTRQPFRTRGRITDLLASGQLLSDAGVPPLNRDTDRVMLCGSPNMLDEMRTLLSAAGYTEGNSGEPGHFAIEKAFVEK
jgi:ferredoxin/flavodoxin---NADP+ reductase